MKIFLRIILINGIMFWFASYLNVAYAENSASYKRGQCAGSVNDAVSDYKITSSLSKHTLDVVTKLDLLNRLGSIANSLIKCTGGATEQSPKGIACVNKLAYEDRDFWKGAVDGSDTLRAVYKMGNPQKLYSLVDSFCGF